LGVRERARQGVLGEVAVDQFREQIDQISVGFDVVDVGGSDKASKSSPASGSIIVSGKSVLWRVMAGLIDRILDQIGIHVDTAVVQK
jgi:hypothetical protein